MNVDSAIEARDQEWRHSIMRALMENGIEDNSGLLTIEPNAESMAFLIRLVMRLGPLRSTEWPDARDRIITKGSES